MIDLFENLIIVLLAVSNNFTAFSSDQLIWTFLLHERCNHFDDLIHWEIFTFFKSVFNNLVNGLIKWFFFYLFELVLKIHVKIASEYNKLVSQKWEGLYSRNNRDSRLFFQWFVLFNQLNNLSPFNSRYLQNWFNNE